MRILTGRAGCKTARALAQYMGVPCKYNLPKNKSIFCVSFGSEKPAHLNNVHIDKLSALKKMGTVVPVPKIYTRQEALNGEPQIFPLLGRNRYHTQGKDIIFISNADDVNNSRSEYFVQFIGKSSEYRVHVTGDTAIYVAAKTHPSRGEAVKGHIWNTHTGWVQFTYTGEHLQTLKALGVAAVKVLGFDFGAVDIIRKGQNFWVLEVNSAPGLIPARMEEYAKFFRQKEAAWKKSLR
jgi:glutathione synthase/RimK-type ligase-like ATP-grasp enzyme